MTNFTGSNNIAGLIGGLVETIETVVDIAGRKLSDFAEETVGGTDQSDEPEVKYQAVSNLALSDALVLDDGSWQVVAIEEDGFDADLVSVALENGENYSLLRTSLVRVL